MELPAEEAIPSEEPAEVGAAEKNAELIAAEQAAREAALKEAEEEAEKAEIAKEESPGPSAHRVPGGFQDGTAGTGSGL